MPVSNDELKGLYYYMNLVRQVDERCRRLFKQGRFHGTYFSAVGQEGTGDAQPALRGNVLFGRR